MIKTILTFALLWISLTTIAQREFAMTEGDTTYIMKRYVFMHLLSGTERSKDSLEAAKMQELHLAHLNKMAESGKLVMAGPFENGGEFRGLLIFDVDSLEEAIKMEAEDPAVKTNRLKMQAFYWWGAKGTKLP
ncbi:YciI family protein [Mangrovibacterium sp.]|uniref:YciI family protein n=1 Tax=Mangrovibacterium sp. TaxID=1961364 RepID=UPI0035685032